MIIGSLTQTKRFEILHPDFKKAKPSETARPTYNEDDYDCAGAPVALTFEYGLVNDFLSEWCEMKTKLNNGEISPNEYFEWKITWPHA